MSFFLFIFFIPFLVVLPYLAFAIAFTLTSSKNLWLYISWFTWIFIWAYTEITKIPGEDDYEILMTMLMVNFVLVYSFLIVKITRIQEKQKINKNKFYNALKTSADMEGFVYITFSLYGFMAAYLLTTFNGDALVGWQPGWIAYLFATSFIFIVWHIPNFASLQEFKQPGKIKIYLSFFSYSFSLVMLGLLIFSLSFPLLVIDQTKQVISEQHSVDSKYCIQMVNVHWKNNYKPISTLLDLSPLTMRSKAPLGAYFGWGDPYFHALLVVRKQDTEDLYNWSYKERVWSYLEAGFAEKQNIEQPEISCTPQKKYLEDIPWIFPKSQRSNI